MSYAVGFDIGGTKCAVSLGRIKEGAHPEIICRSAFSTKEFGTPYGCIERMLDVWDEMRGQYPKLKPMSIGISCGGPLDPVRGIIQSPPNLPGWDDIPIVDLVARRTSFPVRLQNDANACALAEWKFGSGRGTQNMVFLTFGTGLGGGIIVNGQLLNGASFMAGECGHFRLAKTGPVGYGKPGSFEGFCSGGGIARQGQMVAMKALQAGKPVSWCTAKEDVAKISAHLLAEAARGGDKSALRIFTACGKRLGEGLALLVDMLNPQCIVIGSIFVRCEDLLRPAMDRVLRREVLPASYRACRILPAQLGEALGDVAAIAVGLPDSY